MINSFTITPRFEKRWISVYSPISIRQYYSSISWGFGLRAGPLMIGSGSIFTNLISNQSGNADVFVGLKVPIYKKSVASITVGSRNISSRSISSLWADVI
ncbi:hypothetical protein AAGF08_19045 [Algoriphagus sp. SE2]|uniref:hypothetical protein n=1 Tax=Algoriphagus sp. SE2 TaxID=3141536 RepID=UPI0031CD65FF